MNYFKHDSAYVDEPVEIGGGTKIWHFFHIQSVAKIGLNYVMITSAN
jgi:UDP-2-acetamido-3-amino-2,3-dideoxy-glucuronate N-acetyltransferase